MMNQVIIVGTLIAVDPIKKELQIQVRGKTLTLKSNFTEMSAPRYIGDTVGIRGYILEDGHAEVEKLTYINHKVEEDES